MKLADRIVRNSWVVWPRLSDTAKAARPDAERAIIQKINEVRALGLNLNWHT